MSKPVTPPFSPQAHKVAPITYCTSSQRAPYQPTEFRPSLRPGAMDAQRVPSLMLGDRRLPRQPPEPASVAAQPNLTTRARVVRAFEMTQEITQMPSPQKPAKPNKSARRSQVTAQLLDQIETPYQAPATEPEPAPDALDSGTKLGQLTRSEVAVAEKAPRPSAAPVIEVGYARASDKKARRQAAKANYLDPSTLRIIDDPLPAHRACPDGKYAPFFRRMRLGQSLQCPPDQVQAVAHAMRKFVNRHSIPARVSGTRDGAGGMGQVAMLPLPERRA